MAFGSLTTGELNCADKYATYLLELHERARVMSREMFIALETFRDDCRTEQEDRDASDRRGRVAAAASKYQREAAELASQDCS